MQRVAADGFSEDRPDSQMNQAAEASPTQVFWPADLLPHECPHARILSFGYDTKITNYGRSSVNKCSIYSHAKDLLFVLSRNAVARRPIIFVAHSLGGIVVKEVWVLELYLIELFFFTN